MSYFPLLGLPGGQHGQSGGQSGQHGSQQVMAHMIHLDGLTWPGVVARRRTSSIHHSVEVEP
ncbi:MAG TPA: hypothetical protein VHS31_06275 [Tepidisphaeraceae bacterium]|nr:hypothetical protein [Tepidisphaeraceae bacterium]